MAIRAQSRASTMVDNDERGSKRWLSTGSNVEVVILAAKLLIAKSKFQKLDRLSEKLCDHTNNI